MKKVKLRLLFIFLGLPLSLFAQKNEAVPFLSNTFQQFPNVRDFALSPNQQEIYFTIESYKKEYSTIAYIHKENGQWSKPHVASFSGQFKDLEPFFAPDGLRLFFASSRPLHKDAKEPKDIDIWYVKRDNLQSPWSAPIHTGTAVNTDKNEFYPAVTNSGNLYFTRFSDDPKRKEDIFLSIWKDGQYQKPQALSDQVNSLKYEFNAFVAPDESFIIFTSYGRKDDMGGGDLYISTKNAEGNWNAAQHLNKGFNSARIDYCPFVDMEQGMLYFTSERSQVLKYFSQKQDLSSLMKHLKQTENGLGRIYQMPINLKDYQ